MRSGLVKKPHFLFEYFLLPIPILESDLAEYFQTLPADEKIYNFLNENNRVFDALVEPWRDRLSDKKGWFAKKFITEQSSEEKAKKFDASFWEFLCAVAEEFKKFKDERDPENKIPRATWMRCINYFLQVYSSQVLLSPQEPDVHLQFLALLKKYVPFTGEDTEETVILWEDILSPGSKVTEYWGKVDKVSELIGFLTGYEKESAGRLLTGKYITYGRSLGPQDSVNPVVQFDAKIFKMKFAELEKPKQEKLLTCLVYAKYSLPEVDELSQGERSNLRTQIEEARANLLSQIKAFLLIVSSDEKLVDRDKFFALDEEAKAWLKQARKTDVASEQQADLVVVAAKSKKAKKKNKKRAGTPVVSILGEEESPPPQQPSTLKASTNNSKDFTGVPVVDQLKAMAEVASPPAPKKEEESFPLHFDDFAIGLLMDREFPKAENLLNSRYFDNDLISEIDTLKQNGSEGAKKSDQYFQERVAVINKKFNEIYDRKSSYWLEYEKQDVVVQKQHLPLAINKLLNDRWDQFKKFWIVYAEHYKTSNGLKEEPFLPASAMRALFIGFIFSAWPSLDQKLTPVINDGENELACDPLGALNIALKDALKKHNFADSITFKKWTPNFNCKFNDDFELDNEACPFTSSAPENSLQIQVATEEIVSEGKVSQAQVAEVLSAPAPEQLQESIPESSKSAVSGNVLISPSAVRKEKDDLDDGIDRVLGDEDEGAIERLRADIEEKERKAKEKASAEERKATEEASAEKERQLLEEKQRTNKIIECLKGEALDDKKIWSLLGELKVYSGQVDDGVPKLGSFSDDHFIQKFKESERCALGSAGYSLEKRDWLFNLVEIREELADHKKLNPLAGEFSEKINTLCEKLKTDFAEELQFTEEQVKLSRNIRNQSVNLIRVGIEALQDKILVMLETEEKANPKVEKTVVPNQGVLNIQDAAVAQGPVNKDDVDPLAAKRKEINDAILMVISKSSKVVNTLFTSQEDTAYLQNAQTTFAARTNSTFKKIVEEHPVLMKFDGIGDAILKILKNVVQLVTLPFGGFLHMHSRHKQGLPRWIQPKRAEGLFRVLQKELPEEIRKAPLPVQPMAPISN